MIRDDPSPHPPRSDRRNVRASILGALLEIPYYPTATTSKPTIMVISQLLTGINFGPTTTSSNHHSLNYVRIRTHLTWFKNFLENLGPARGCSFCKTRLSPGRALASNWCAHLSPPPKEVKTCTTPLAGCALPAGPPRSTCLYAVFSPSVDFSVAVPSTGHCCPTTRKLRHLYDAPIGRRHKSTDTGVLPFGHVLHIRRRVTCSHCVTTITTSVRVL